VLFQILRSESCLYVFDPAEVDRLGSCWVLPPCTGVQCQSGFTLFQGSRTVGGLSGKMLYESHTV